MAYTFRYDQPCTACFKGTNEACDQCGKPFCGHGACLFETGKQLTFPPDPRDEYPQEWSRPEELCMECYTKSEGHPPFSIWAETSMHTVLAFNLLQKGSIVPAGDAHSWYAPPIVESHKRTEAALRADAGIIDYSQYE